MSAEYVLCAVFMHIKSAGSSQFRYVSCCCWSPDSIPDLITVIDGLWFFLSCLTWADCNHRCSTLWICKTVIIINKKTNTHKNSQIEKGMPLAYLRGKHGKGTVTEKLLRFLWERAKCIHAQYMWKCIIGRVEMVEITIEAQ